MACGFKHNSGSFSKSFQGGLWPWGISHSKCLAVLVQGLFLPADSIQRSEISKRDGKIAEIAETFSAECELRRRTEQERNELEGALVSDAN